MQKPMRNPSPCHPLAGAIFSVRLSTENCESPGNCVVLFRSPDVAKDVIRRLSRKALVEAPGLQLVCTGLPFDWNKQSLAAAMSTVVQQLARDKRQRPLSSPLLGLGVTRKCASTELPAVGETKKF